MIDIREKLDAIGPYVPAPDDDMQVCRCEEVTKGEIRQAVHAGMLTIEEIRRFLRCGMGLSGTDLWQAGEGHCGKGTSCVTS